MYENAILRLRSGQYEFEKRVNFLYTMLNAIALGKGVEDDEDEKNLKSEIKWTREQIKEFELAIKKLGEKKGRLT